jgi:hypothetical protein
VVAERVGRDHVVAVHEGQEVAARVLDAGVAGGAQTAVLLLDQPEAGVLLGVPGRDGRAAVRGPVVHHHDLEIVPRLHLKGAQALVEIPLDVVDGYDDTECDHK